MIELSKIASRHDSCFKLSPSTSNETSIYLPHTISDAISPVSGAISFVLYKEDFVKAVAVMCRIPNIYFKKELYSTSPRLINSFLYQQIESQFGHNPTSRYYVYHLKRDDGRCYLNTLLQDNGFNIRCFLVEKYTRLSFERESSGLYAIRLSMEAVHESM